MITSMRKNTAITLIALIITIIALLILAGVTIALVTGDNGIVKQAVKAAQQTEEAVEKEKVSFALVAATNDMGEITDESLKNACNSEFGEGKTKSKVFEDGTIIILVEETNREYVIDRDGNITGSTTKPVEDEEGLSGSGTEADPYKIQSIEDLVYLSEQVNNGTSYNGRYITLERDLDFKSFNSYIDATKIVDEEKNIDLMTSLITGEGFLPIGKNTSFQGKLDGKNNKILNLYENIIDGKAGLIGVAGSCTVKNLTLNVDVTSQTEHAGGLIGRGSGTGAIENCKVYGNVNAPKGYAGGLIRNDSKFFSSHFRLRAVCRCNAV